MAFHQQGSEPFGNAPKRKEANLWEAIAVRLRELAVLQRSHADKNTTKAAITTLSRTRQELITIRDRGARGASSCVV
eukprot:2749463-Pyramimonas_sp.AAC.1